MYMRLFHLENLFVTCSCSFIVFFFFRNRENRGGRGGRGEDAWSVKCESIELWCSQRTIAINSMLPSEIVSIYVYRSPSKAS